MTNKDLDHAVLGLTAVLAGIVRTLDGRYPGILRELDAHLAVIYPSLRDAPGAGLPTLQVLRDFGECLKMT